MKKWEDLTQAEIDEINEEGRAYMEYLKLIAKSEDALIKQERRERFKSKLRSIKRRILVFKSQVKYLLGK